MEDIMPAFVVKGAVERSIPESGDFTSREVAEKALAWLQERAPDDLIVWQQDLALDQLREMASHILQKRRSEARVVMRGEAFASTLKAVRAGENPLRAVYVVSDDNTRRAVADMTADDLLFVSRGYMKQSNRLKLEGYFFKELAKRVPDGQTVKDVLDSEEFGRLYRSINPTDMEDENG